MPPPPLQVSLHSTASYFDMPPTDIVPPRSPTVLRPASMSFSGSTMSDSSSSSHDSYGYQRDAEFYATTRDAQLQSSGYQHGRAPSSRPQANRSFSTFEAGLPSLTNTPSSSIGTAASWSSYRALPARHDPSAGHYPRKSIDLVIPVIPTTAPSSPVQHVNESSLKSSASTITSFRVAEAEDMSFARQNGNYRHEGQTSSSLKQLLNRSPAHTGSRQH